jgi:hypothetical protein
MHKKLAVIISVDNSDYIVRCLWIETLHTCISMYGDKSAKLISRLNKAYEASNGRIIKKNELERMWKESVLA